MINIAVLDSAQVARKFRHPNFKGTKIAIATCLAKSTLCLEQSCNSLEKSSVALFVASFLVKTEGKKSQVKVPRKFMGA